MKLTVTEINVQTGEEITFERDETPQEEAFRLQLKANADAEKAETEAKAQAKAALLAQLGITEEQAKLLLS